MDDVLPHGAGPMHARGAPKVVIRPRDRRGSIPPGDRKTQAGRYVSRRPSVLSQR